MTGLLKRCLDEKRTVEIIYMSDGGSITQRTIIIREMNEKALKAHCLLRNKSRTFKLENILSAEIKNRRGSGITWVI